MEDDAHSLHALPSKCPVGNRSDLVSEFRGNNVQADDFSILVSQGPNQTFAQVALNCPANTTYNWAPKLTPYPGQDAADLLVEMASSLDVDCKHKGATDAFADECAIYTGVNPGARLDLGLDYGPPMAGCQSLAEALKKRKPHRAMPPKPEDAKGHTGTDCKAGLLEIINVSDNVKLG